ncbi:MAG TPA: hypothetical protein VHH54_06645 [Actinomycetota bacterium]|nr:hypothetical protein [Actinomycetota bacterium]
MREGESGREPLSVRGGRDGEHHRYLSMLFSDLGDFPPLERPRRGEEEVETAEVGPDGNAAGSHPSPNGSLTVKPQTVRPFIEEVLNVPTAPEAGQVSRGRWKVAALWVVGFFAVAGTAAATLSVGYQASARDRQVIPGRAGVFPQFAEDSGSTDAVAPDANIAGFQGCTKGKGLSPLGLMLVARAFVSTTTEPAVCLPAEKPRKKDSRVSKSQPSADQTTSTPTIVGTSGSSGSSGGAPAPGSGSGGTPGTGTGGGGTDPTPTPPPPPPPDGGTTEPEKPGNGWGKGGKPKGSATG